MIEVTKLSSWSPEHQAIIEECWSKRGCERRYTVPKAIKLKLCELAIAHVMALQRQIEDARPQIEAALQRSMSTAEAKLRDRGWTDEEIAAWFKKLSERARKRSKKEFKKPSVDKVFEILTRHAQPLHCDGKPVRLVDDRELEWCNLTILARNCDGCLKPPEYFCADFSQRPALCMAPRTNKRGAMQCPWSIGLPGQQHGRAQKSMIQA